MFIPVWVTRADAHDDLTQAAHPSYGVVLLGNTKRQQFLQLKSSDALYIVRVSEVSRGELTEYVTVLMLFLIDNFRGEQVTPSGKQSSNQCASFHVHPPGKTST